MCVLKGMDVNGDGLAVNQMGCLILVGAGLKYRWSCTNRARRDHPITIMLFCLVITNDSSASIPIDYWSSSSQHAFSIQCNIMLSNISIL